MKDLFEIYISSFSLNKTMIGCHCYFFIKSNCIFIDVAKIQCKIIICNITKNFFAFLQKILTFVPYYQHLKHIQTIRR